MAIYTRPGPLPFDAGMNTQELHRAQAIALCCRVLAEQQTEPTERAIAVCRLGHLVGDAHQRCHAGSLYAENVFRTGDRGGNLIKVVQAGNLNALWGGLLGRRFNEGDVARRVREIRDAQSLMSAGRAAAQSSDGLESLTWSEESRRVARAIVYSPEILSPLRAVSSGALTQLRACEASHRLATIWRYGLSPRP